MPAIAAGFAFTYQDRRRLKAAMRPVRDARHYRRLEAVWLVAEGHSVGATDHLLNASRRSRHQGAGPLPSASPPGGSGRRQTLGSTARGARANPRALSPVAADRSDELGLRGRGLDGSVAERVFEKSRFRHISPPMFPIPASKQLGQTLVRVP